MKQASLCYLSVILFSLVFNVSADTRGELRPNFDNAVKNKTVAWVPITLGNPLGDMWTAAMRQNFDKYGINFVVRDPNFNSHAQLQAVTALINEKPDVLIVQNPNVSLLAREIKRAMDLGIYVVQVNMMSNQLSDAYVGVDNEALGRVIAEDIVKECGQGSGSGKVALVQGEATSAGSLEQLKGAMQVFEKTDAIKVVSSQAANWDSNKANEITSTVLQQHPDLCATYGFWGIMQQGSAQAVKNAGLQNKVKVYASSDGPRSDCNLVEQGLFHKILSYRADIQGEQIANAVLMLLQSDNPPGSHHFSLISNSFWINSADDRDYCFDLPETP
ncbi:sugar ABC transporter substrate-binding protein [Methylophaga sp. OBS4]|uniref:sugar ABC transporter substrate-binding protein n=1 Tax=Methylophaga sp. OBS4 TaxID=2991935 RepID=UPI00225903DB|nr:sugar ABC transporter substrate-binding protein [Methylophaga sp. OBS4]MCX4188252.1 sugar ABC transporter substrate-binding protein [Methylophaga sp. OBS4]